MSQDIFLLNKERNEGSINNNDRYLDEHSNGEYVTWNDSVLKDSINIGNIPHATTVIQGKGISSQVYIETSWTVVSGLLLIFYLIMQTLMPYYNKISLQLYNYPITSSFIQVCGVTILLAFTVGFKRIFWDNVLFSDKRFLLKLKYLFLPALFFSFNIILTNIGISMTSVDVHVLLRSTEIIWFVFLSGMLTTEYPTCYSALSAFITTIGVILFSWASLDNGSVSFEAVVINILSALFSPLQIIFLRRASRILTNIENETRQMDGINVLNSKEITIIKMFMSLFMILIAGLCYEKPHAFKELSHNYGKKCNTVQLIIGIMFTTLLQWNVVALTGHVESVLIGVAQQSKTIWVFLLSLIIGGTSLHVCKCDTSLGNDGHCDADNYPKCPCFSNAKDAFHGTYAPYHIIGVIFIFIGLIYYMYLKYRYKNVTNTNQFKFWT